MGRRAPGPPEPARDPSVALPDGESSFAAAGMPTQDLPQKRGSGEPFPMPSIPASRVVSIHPYFKVQPGKMDEARRILARFVSHTTPETGNLYYHFTIREDVVHCREAYDGAEALLTHLENVGPVLAEFLQIATVVRLEIHGSAPEITKLRSAFEAMNPEWYVFECGVERPA